MADPAPIATHEVAPFWVIERIKYLDGFNKRPVYISSWRGPVAGHLEHGYTDSIDEAQHFATQEAATIFLKAELHNNEAFEAREHIMVDMPRIDILCSRVVKDIIGYHQALWNAWQQLPDGGAEEVYHNLTHILADERSSFKVDIERLTRERDEALDLVAASRNWRPTVSRSVPELVKMLPEQAAQFFVPPIVTPYAEGVGVRYETTIPPAMELLTELFRVMAARTASLTDQVGKLKAAAKSAAVSLIAAVSILERAHKERKPPHLVVASKKMFEQILRDYNKDIAAARAVLATEPDGESRG